MVVHIVLEQPKNGQRSPAPLIGACGKRVGGLYTRSRAPSSRTCPACLTVLAKRGPGEVAEPEAGARSEDDPGPG
jgi:hypothetical protein